MTQTRDAERARELYDVERYVRALNGGVLVEDPYPDFARLREASAVHHGSVNELLGVPGGQSMRPSAQHFSAWSYEANAIALKDNEVFSSSYYEGGATKMFGRSILEMTGSEHRRYRALVQPSFVPRRASWWIEKWIEPLVEERISDIETETSAELNIDLCSRIPLHTITASFGMSREDAWQFRESLGGGAAADPAAAARRTEIAGALLKSVIEARRIEPQDDLITTLVEAELDEDGVRHELTDEEIMGFARLILTAGSGTTWRQLGILLIALLRQPDLLDAVREDRTLLDGAIEEAVRWEPTDPVFRRLVTRDVELCGVDLPAGAVLELNLGSANRDPARWDSPDTYDPFRKSLPHLGFASGPHICLGMHVARAEMSVAMNAVLDRLPNLRLDSSKPAPRIVGLEHRGPNAIPVVFG